MGKDIYLAPHGVEGMHWYKRRYQNEDGSLTPEGRAHYGVGEQKEKSKEDGKGSADKNIRSSSTRSKKNLAASERSGISGRKSEGNKSQSSDRKRLSEKDQKARQDKVRKFLGVAAAVAVTAVAAHYVSKGLGKLDHKYTEALERGVDITRPFKHDLDQQRNMAYMVPKGAKIQRLSRFDEAKSKGHAYVTFDPEDNARYKGFFGRILQGSAAVDKALGRVKGTTPYVHDIEARENLLSPSKRDRINTFLGMYKDDPVGMGKTLGKYHTIEYHDRGRLPAFVYQKQYAHLRGTKKITKGYRTFVKAIGDAKNKSLRDEYFRRIREKGYNMIQDDQDSGRSGLRPSIVIDRARSLKYNGKRELLGTEVKESLKKYGRRVAKENRHREWL